jgi:hypothetical protein
MPNVISLHRRLDRLDTNDGASIAVAMEQAKRAHEARQVAWTAAGHLGAPPHRSVPSMSPEAPHGDKALWRMVAEGRARAVQGTSDTSPFTSLASIYTLSNDALLAAINAHPLYAGWAEYDDKPDAAEVGRRIMLVA